jgi:putative glutamine amidotransferase
MNMRRLFFFLLVMLGMLSCSNDTHKALVNLQDLESSTPKILLMNPTVRNLKTFTYLVDEGILPLPDSYQVIGIFHELGEYNFKQSVNFIEKEHLQKINLIEINPDLTSESLYGFNECSLLFKELFEKSDGVIFFGGPDIPPSTYGKTTNLLTEITDIHRHFLEISFLYHLLGGYQDTLYNPLLREKPEYRVLGICLGMQSMNVATGGTLIQDIPTELYGLSQVEQVLEMEIDNQHRNYHTNFGVDRDLIWGSFHQIKFESNSLFDSLNSFGSVLPYVWSSHHQCIDKLGKGIIPMAWSMDGKIIEAVTHCEFPNVIGVQFHPEIPALYKSDEKLKQYPDHNAEFSYIDMYTDNGGVIFHRAFWQHFGEKF